MCPPAGVGVEKNADLCFSAISSMSASGMRRIGGHEQRRLPGMARGQMQCQSAGDSRLAYSALAYDKSQLATDGFYRKGRKGRKEF